MSERKVLNKYYPPDFDPSKIPRMKLAKNRQYTVRLMAPFNMRCITCGEYIYKGKKFNARKEDVENDTYLGIRIYRFYIKCTRCLQEISFKTDPKNTDYEIEEGATRNFMALKLAEEQARKEEEELREEEANNPMKLLENRTQQSRNEIELLESLEELKDLNRRQQSVDYDTMLQQFDTTETERQRLERQEKEDEEFIKTITFKNSKKCDETNIRNSSNDSKRIVTEEIIEYVDDDVDHKCKESKRQYENLFIEPTLKKVKSSIGSLSYNKNSFKNLVVKRTIPQNRERETTTSSKSSNDDNQSLNICNKMEDITKNKTAGGLALLAAYSDSDNSD